MCWAYFRRKIAEQQDQGMKLRKKEPHPRIKVIKHSTWRIGIIRKSWKRVLKTRKLVLNRDQSRKAERKAQTRSQWASLSKNVNSKPNSSASTSYKLARKRYEPRNKEPTYKTWVPSFLFENRFVCLVVELNRTNSWNETNGEEVSPWKN